MSGGVKGWQGRWRSWSAVRPALARRAGAGCHGGQDHSLRRLRRRPGRLCNNMLLAVQQIAVGEAFVLSEKSRSVRQSLFDVIAGATGNCWAVIPTSVRTLSRRRPTTISSPGSPTRDLMNKDLGLAMNAVAFVRISPSAATSSAAVCRAAPDWTSGAVIQTLR